MDDKLTPPFKLVGVYRVVTRLLVILGGTVWSRTVEIRGN